MDGTGLVLAPGGRIESFLVCVIINEKASEYLPERGKVHFVCHAERGKDPLIFTFQEVCEVGHTEIFFHVKIQHVC